MWRPRPPPDVSGFGASGRVCGPPPASRLQPAGPPSRGGGRRRRRASPGRRSAGASVRSAPWCGGCPGAGGPGFAPGLGPAWGPRPPVPGRRAARSPGVGRLREPAPESSPGGAAAYSQAYGSVLGDRSEGSRAGSRGWGVPLAGEAPRAASAPGSTSGRSSGPGRDTRASTPHGPRRASAVLLRLAHRRRLHASCRRLPGRPGVARGAGPGERPAPPLPRAGRLSTEGRNVASSLPRRRRSNIARAVVASRPRWR